MTSKRRLPGRLAAGFLILLAMLLFYPVRSETTRSGIIVCFAGVVICLTWMLWRRRWLRWLPAAPVAMITLFLILPGRPIDRMRLKVAYLAALQRYEGTRYVWGGETWRGVDCSGLLRAALVEAHITESLRTLNPALARQALWFWWHDASAREMSDGYQGQTVRLGTAVPLQDMPKDSIEPGDLAVTQDGSHVLAYLAPDVWIDADPYVLRVIKIEHHETSPWNIVKVIPCRWHCLHP